MKYQFCIRFNNIDANSAASKAVLDCNEILSRNGYKDYTFTVGDNANKKKYYLLLFKELVNFFFAVKRGSIVAIQYPLLSINHVFRHFIKIARLKGVKFYCIIHDVESLRNGGNDKLLIEKEISNLNYFDIVIAHNQAMITWLKENGLRPKTVSLELFDYLGQSAIKNEVSGFERTIAFAGNLSKSRFIYRLGAIKSWSFNLFGPNFSTDKPAGGNVAWRGSFNPEEIVDALSGCFGLIWDGLEIEKCDDVLGQYLFYNNPHKFSLYMAAGLPVIAPAGSAIASFILRNNVGVLAENLMELDHLTIDDEAYEVMRRNAIGIGDKVKMGYYLQNAIEIVEKEIRQQ
jgi:hypothetical protein